MGALHPQPRWAAGESQVTPYLLYIKLGAAVLLIAGIFGAGFHVGGMASRTALEADHAAMAQAATTALLAQRKQAEAESTRINKAVSDYENTPIDFISPTVARRVFLYAHRADCPVPSTPSVAGRTQAAAPVTLGPSDIERALGAYIAACSADSSQMKAMLELAP
jgi:hypothetical protein